MYVVAIWHPDTVAGLGRHIANMDQFFSVEPKKDGEPRATPTALPGQFGYSFSSSSSQETRTKRSTGNVARTATNVRAGARGPIAGMFHSVFLLLFMLVAAPLASFIPLSALAAVPRKVPARPK